MNKKYKILISNVNFGNASPVSLEQLEKNAFVIKNNDNKRFEFEDFMVHDISNVDIIIAGTEKICERVISNAKKLKLICRVGAGIDNVDLDAAFSKDIKITYTPDAPGLAVPEFTLALILNLIKGVSVSDRFMHQRKWCRPMGRSLKACKLGVIGAGNIGRQVIKLFLRLEPNIEIVFYDPYVDFVDGAKKITYFDELFKICNIISLHLPLSSSTYHIVSKTQLDFMPQGSYLVNTSRGGIVNEKALYSALQSNLAGAAIDVFETEPYTGILCDLQNCLLTSHIGSMIVETRAIMEQQILEDVINFINNKPLLRSFNYKQHKKSINKAV